MMILKFTILAVLLLGGQPLAHAGLPPKTWEPGKLISVNRVVHVQNIAMRPRASYLLSVIVQIKTGAYIVDGFMDKDRAPKVIENDFIQYRIDNEKLFLLDADGKEIKLKIIKIRKP